MELLGKRVMRQTKLLADVHHAAVNVVVSGVHGSYGTKNYVAVDVDAYTKLAKATMELDKLLRKGKKP